jgi:hypothetical protein
MKIENKNLQVHSDKNGNIVLNWVNSDMKCIFTIENARLLVEVLLKAISYEEGLRNVNLE